ncbi:Predicted arabinose efflux permease, MFS family [Anaerosphaera aminiphila DSM 21120]|uniref:Predicted arabinose efflux permease, MFS family n=1 Tax=Anaerosphaera aminiphila DSM 21120 TaxID=1120995 RepID=A0A1M5UA23_9FIRM|nr:MFS transporter [Anaerosphaera aminiphila]SHH59809.1 Predicted arabinose efflux permease, MFS family [Anaerosphaera aminiphila DSM 21120]
MDNSKKSQSIWTKNFILISIINFLIYCCWQMFPPSLPPYVSSLGGADNILGWLNGVATIATLVIRPFSGSIMDKFGRRGIFNFGLILLIISSLAFYFSPFIGIIFAIRFIHGIAWGVASTASNTIATDNIKKDNMPKGMAYFSLSVSLASGVAPAIALSINTKTMFLTASAFVLVAFLMNFAIDYPKQVLNTEKSSKKVSPYEKKSILPAFLMFLVTTTYGAIVTFVALLAAEKGIANIGLFFTLYAVGMLVVRPFLGSIIDKRGFGVVIVPSAVLSIVALLILSNANTYVAFLMSGTLYGIGYGALHTCFQTLSVISVEPNRTGAANATFFTGFDAGMGFGSIIAGSISARVGYSSMFGILSLWFVAIIIIYLLSSRHIKKVL